MNCRSCRAPIRWAIMASGKRNPLNPDPDPDRGNVLVCDTIEDAERHEVVVGRAVALGPAAAASYRAEGRDLFLSHFVTCPTRAQHRASAGKPAP